MAARQWQEQGQSMRACPMVITTMIVACLTACGSAGDALSAQDVEQQLTEAMPKNNAGSRFTEPQCIDKGSGTFRCLGIYSASRKSVEENMGAIDTSDFGERDWKVLQEQASGPVTFNVDVADDGSMIFNAEP